MSHGSHRPTRSNDRRRQRTPPPRFELLQVVYVRVETLERPYPAYLVEFIDDDGSTKTEAAFTPDQLSAAPPPP